MIEVYVDGSFKPKVSSNHVGCGFVVIKDGEIIHEFSKLFEGGEYAKHRNITGEVLATMLSIAWVKKNHPNVKKIVVYHDYVGIAGWANEWKTNCELSKLYKKFMLAYKSRFDFKFVKVKSHSGNYFNNLADNLANKAFDSLTS